MSTNLAAESKNFLIPNGTFFVETIIFLVVLWIFWQFIVPPIRKAMRERNDLIQKGIEEGRQAEEKFRDAEQRYQQALNEARNEAAKIRDTARAGGQGRRRDRHGRALMAEFIVELIALVVMAYVIWRYVVPPVRTIMRN